METWDIAPGGRGGGNKMLCCQVKLTINFLLHILGLQVCQQSLHGRRLTHVRHLHLPAEIFRTRCGAVYIYIGPPDPGRGNIGQFHLKENCDKMEGKRGKMWQKKKERGKIKLMGKWKIKNCQKLSQKGCVRNKYLHIPGRGVDTVEEEGWIWFSDR